MRGLLAALSLALALPFSAQSADPLSYEVSIDTGSTGTMPKTLLPSLFAGWAKENGLPYLRDFETLGYVRMQIEYEIAQSHSMTDLMHRISKRDPIFRELDRAGAKIVLSLARMPRWLSASSDATPTCHGWRVYEASPPKSYAAYRKMVAAIVDHYHNQLGIDVIYNLWAEPDASPGARMPDGSLCMWRAGQDDLIELMRHFAIAVKQTEPSARTALPSSYVWFGEVTQTAPLSEEILRGIDYFGLSESQLEQSLVHQLIKNFASTSVPELNAERVPLDFVAIHHFGPNWRSFADGVEQVRSWAEGYGYDVEILATEWNVSRGNTLANAAAHVAFMAYTTQLGIAGACRSGLQDNSPFIRHGTPFGIVTQNEAVKKPAFYALQLLSKLRGQLTETLTDSPNLTALASVDGTSVYLLLANYADPEAQTLTWLASDPAGREFLAEKDAKVILKGYAELSPQRRQQLAQRYPVLLQMEEQYAFYSRLAREPQHVVINGSLLFDSVVEQYLVDSTHSNMFHHYDHATERGLPPQAALLYAKKATSLDQLASRNYSKGQSIEMELEPNAVTLLIVKRE